jgi:5-methylcytosine-specific restriction endonuclease McrA
MKNCKKCLVTKSVSDFYKHKGICKDCFKEKNKKYKDENAEHLKEIAKDWYHKTKEDRRSLKATYYRERRKKDDLFRLRSNLSRLVRTSMYRGGYKKDTMTENILGCSYIDFKLFIESKWEDWMNWDNYGLYNGELNYGWDLDHIIPISSGLTKDDIVGLSYYTNYQPLCSKINRDLKRDNL